MEDISVAMMGGVILSGYAITGKQRDRGSGLMAQIVQAEKRIKYPMILPTLASLPV